MRVAVVLFVVMGACAAEIGTGGGDGASGPPVDGGASDAPMSADLGGACTTNADCKGGACVAGRCCGSTAQVCGTQCCPTGSTCLFDQCVVPGKPCHTENDCASDQYCETALGGAVDAGMPNADAGCTQPLPLGGRCLARPSVCVDGGVGDMAGCVAACEYHPPSTGPLDAVPKWTWGPTAKELPDVTDVWATPTVGRLYDANCDGVVNELDPPSVVFVSGNASGTCCQCDGKSPTACHTGALRVLDGASGKEIWSLAKASNASAGFAGLSTALGDIDGDGRLDIVAATGEGYVVMVDATGKVVRTSDKPIPNAGAGSFGWGGGLAIADMDGDGAPEIAYGATLFTTTGGTIKWLFTGTGGSGGTSSPDTQLSTFADLDGDGKLELLAGKAAYRKDGSTLWTRPDLPDGFPAVGDFDKNGKPETVLVVSGKLWILDGATGKTLLGPAMLPGTGDGGPPTVADFDGDGKPEVGVAQANFYSVWKPDLAKMTLAMLWKTPNHDYSSSVTGSTVFDFEGDGRAEVIYGDECYLWVFDGQTGAVRFAAMHTSFTGTEASIVADVDGDGRAEIVMVSNGASPMQWGCTANGKPTTVNGVTWVPGPTANQGYRGIVVFGDVASSWVGTRTLWNEHTYHVSNICDDRDSACASPNVYGSIPKQERANWTVSWLDDFRQNVQDKGVFDAPDATVTMTVECASPAVLHPAVRNIGLATLVAGVDVQLYKNTSGGMPTLLGDVKTTHPLGPGQTEVLSFPVAAGMGTSSDLYTATIYNDPKMPHFHECRDDNDSFGPVTADCLQ